MALDYKNWTPVADVYNPIIAGSIDGTDTEPHDHGIVRAMNSTYRPNKGVAGDPECTLMIARLNHITSEDTLKSVFNKYGQIKSIRLVRDLITGFSKGYAFLQYYDRHATHRALCKANKMVVDDKEILVEIECERTMKGWIPRRFGGGLGGRKESGQLRFGGSDRPFRKPIILVKPKTEPANAEFGREKPEREWERSVSREGRSRGDRRGHSEGQAREKRDYKNQSEVDQRDYGSRQSNERDRSYSRERRHDHMARNDTRHHEKGH